MDTCVTLSDGLQLQSPAAVPANLTLNRMQGVPYSMQSMLKDGHKMLSGLEEAVIKNIEACKQLSTMARTSMGPNGDQIVNQIARDAQDLVLTRASSL